MLAGQVAVAEEDGEATQRQLTHSYCCIDYPRFIDMLQVPPATPLHTLECVRQTQPLHCCVHAVWHIRMKNEACE